MKTIIFQEKKNCNTARRRSKLQLAYALSRAARSDAKADPTKTPTRVPYLYCILNSLSYTGMSAPTVTNQIRLHAGSTSTLPTLNKAVESLPRSAKSRGLRRGLNHVIYSGELQ